MGAHRRLMLALASLGLMVSSSGCAAGLGGADGVTAAEAISTDAAAAQARTGAGDSEGNDGAGGEPAGGDPEGGDPEGDDPARSDIAGDDIAGDDTGSDDTAPGSQQRERASSQVPRGPTRDGTPGPSRSPTLGSTKTPTATRPSASRTIVPRPSYSPFTMCPDIGELNPVFSAKRLGTDSALGTDIVELTFTYTNPLGHALFLMGSVGYVDSEGYESDLYARPGGLVFDDVRLERGTHTIVLQLEDLWGEASGARISFTYWSLAGTALDSSRPVPCEPSRGYSSH